MANALGNDEVNDAFTGSALRPLKHFHTRKTPLVINIGAGHFFSHLAKRIRKPRENLALVLERVKYSL